MNFNLIFLMNHCTIYPVIATTAFNRPIIPDSNINFCFKLIIFLSLLGQNFSSTLQPASPTSSLRCIQKKSFPKSLHYTKIKERFGFFHLRDKEVFTMLAQNNHQAGWFLSLLQN